MRKEATTEVRGCLKLCLQEEKNFSRGKKKEKGGDYGGALLSWALPARKKKSLKRKKKWEKEVTTEVRGCLEFCLWGGKKSLKRKKKWERRRLRRCAAVLSSACKKKKISQEEKKRRKEATTEVRGCLELCLQEKKISQEEKKMRKEATTEVRGCLELCLWCYLSSQYLYFCVRMCARACVFEYV
jgi:hypothetical protein